MDVRKTILNGVQLSVLRQIEEQESELNSALDALREEQAELTKSLNEIKERIQSQMMPLLAKKVPLAEMKAGIASRISRAKYYPEFATKHFDDSKDAEFLGFVNKQLSPDKANDA